MAVRPIDASGFERELIADMSLYGEKISGDEAYSRALLLLAGAPTLTPPNEWVSVEDAMPPEHEPVLCIVDGKPKPNITLEDAYQIGSWNKADGWIIDEYLDWEDADVSWWMALPAPPDKGNNVLAKTPNEPLTCDGCIHEHNEHENCNYCKRASYLGDYYYPSPPEGEEDT